MLWSSWLSPAPRGSPGHAPFLARTLTTCCPKGWVAGEGQVRERRWRGDRWGEQQVKRSRWEGYRWAWNMCVGGRQVMRRHRWGVFDYLIYNHTFIYRFIMSSELRDRQPKCNNRWSTRLKHGRMHTKVQFFLLFRYFGMLPHIKMNYIAIIWMCSIRWCT